MSNRQEDFIVIGEKNNLSCTETIPVSFFNCNFYEEIQEDCTVLREHRLSIFVNDNHLGDVVCSPIQLTALVIGHLITCNVIDSTKEIDRIVYNEDNSECRVNLKGPLRTLINRSEMITSCENNQLFGKKEEEMKPQKHRLDFKPEDIKKLAEIFKEDTPLHALTHGTHSCSLAVNSEIVYMCEDLGRHNALDKIIGLGVMNGIDFTKSIVYTSGRVPLDMMNKIIRAGIALIASNAVPTQQAIALARKNNVVLIGRTKPSGFIMYT